MFTMVTMFTIYFVSYEKVALQGRKSKFQNEKVKNSRTTLTFGL